MATLSGLLGSSFSGIQGRQGVQGVQGLMGPVLTTVPQNSQTSQYELVASDSGKHVSTTANIIIPASVFSVGDTITIFNNSGSNISISTKTGQIITLYLAWTASTGTRTLTQRGICTILCIIAGFQPSFVIAGSGLT